MAGWIGEIVTAAGGLIVNPIKELAGKWIDDKDKKRQFDLGVDKIIQENAAMLEETLRTEIGAKERILVAELQQGDNYTKRARPSVIYVGLLMMLLNYIVLPLLGAPVSDLPAEFWYGWTGLVATYSIGRSFEKKDQTAV